MNGVGYKVKKNNFIHITDPAWCHLYASIPAYDGECDTKRRRDHEIIYTDPKYTFKR